MPLKLKSVLAKRRISIADLRKAIIQSNGAELSASAASQLLNWGIWPQATPEEEIRGQALAFLRARKVQQRLLADIWEEDEEAIPYGQGVKARRNAARRQANADAANSDDFELPETEMLSQQARQHFQLFRDPFLDDVQGPEDVFLDGEQRYIRESMFQAAKHGGFLAVVGESGAGKTVLRKDLIDRIQRDGEAVTVIQPRAIDKTRLTAAHIAEAIIADVSIEKARQTLEAKSRQIERLLTASSRAGNRHVLLIEEAHDLSTQTLKYLKRFWELEDGFTRLLAVVLIGQPELKARLDERTNAEAREVIRRCEIAELRPLDHALEAYLALKFSRVGKEVSKIFTPDAFDAIRSRLTLTRRSASSISPVSMLYPLVVNNLVRKAMNLAAQVGEPLVTAEVIKGV
jgi:type II secretory pathway predicted ATPase ExeA